MTHKLLLTMTLVVGLAHGANMENNTLVTTTETKSEVTTKAKQAVWNPPLGNVKSGASCDDGNCFSDLNLDFCKEYSPMYKVVTSVRDEMKRFFRRF